MLKNAIYDHIETIKESSANDSKKVQTNSYLDIKEREQILLML